MTKIKTFRTKINGFLDTRMWKSRWKSRMHSDVKKWCEKHNAKLTADQKTTVEKFWKQYSNEFNPRFHTKYTAVTGIFDARYVPDDLYFTEIVPYLNEGNSAFGNKSYMPLIFNCEMPITVFQRINGFYLDREFNLITETQAYDLCLNFKSLVFKPSMKSMGGKSVIKISCSDMESVKKAIKLYGTMKSYIVQEAVIQHQNLSAIHENSVNTVRIVTFLNKNGVHVLKPVLRFGINNSIVDNMSIGGLACGINPDGRLKNRAYDIEGNAYEQHPQGYVFENCVIPSFSNVMEFAKNQAARLPYHRLIAWDIAIKEDGNPILIEANLAVPGIDLMQFCNGALFGDLTEDVLQEVFIRH